MKLRPRIEPEPPRELRFRLPAETHAELELYGLLYAEEYGHEIDVPTLAAEILQQFLEGDRAFRVFKKRRARANGNGAAAQPEARA